MDEYIFEIIFLKRNYSKAYRTHDLEKIFILLISYFCFLWKEYDICNLLIFYYFYKFSADGITTVSYYYIPLACYIMYIIPSLYHIMYADMAGVFTVHVEVLK